MASQYSANGNITLNKPESIIGILISVCCSCASGDENCGEISSLKKSFLW
jgi:hypothetical protein